MKHWLCSSSYSGTLYSPEWRDVPGADSWGTWRPAGWALQGGPKPGSPLYLQDTALHCTALHCYISLLWSAKFTSHSLLLSALLHNLSIDECALLCPWPQGPVEVETRFIGPSVSVPVWPQKWYDCRAICSIQSNYYYVLCSQKQNKNRIKLKQMF